MDQIGPKLGKDGTTDFAAVDDLITYLEIAFGDPNDEDTSQRQLRELRQAERVFSDYLGEFRRIAARTGYSDEAKRAALLAGLSQEIQQYLVVIDLSDSLEEVITQIQKIDNKLRALNSRALADSKHQKTQTGILAPRPGPQSERVQSASSSPASVSSHLSNVTLAARALESGVSGTRRSLTLVERRHRTENNLCMYCGKADHNVGNCPGRIRKDISREKVVDSGKHSANPPTSIKSTRPSTP